MTRSNKPETSAPPSDRPRTGDRDATTISVTSPSTTAIRRRDFVRRAALGGVLAGAGLGMATLDASVDEAVAGTATPNPADGVNLFSDQANPLFNFLANFALGAAGQGAAEVGEVIATANLINTRGLSYASYVEEFTALGDRLARIGERALAGGHKVSAREAFLRASSYYTQALFFVLGTTRRAREAQAYASAARQFDRAAQLFDPPFERVRIPYAGTYLPGYFLSPDGSRRKRPTIILTNGSDGQNIDMWVTGGAAALARGFNALIYDGPGQGSMLFERQIPFRPDWEKVVTPIVDYLHTRNDVDTRRIVLSGVSFAGELVVRAAAFEHRLAAVVSDPGSVDTFLAYPASLRDLLQTPGGRTAVNRVWNHEAIPTLTSLQRFELAKRAEIYAPEFLHAARAGKVFTDLWAFGKIARRYTNADVIHRVRTPTMSIGYEFEAFYPGQYVRLHDALRCEKAQVLFTVAEGAEYHNGPLAPQRRNEVVFDWLDDVLRK
jgi:hypothetical protein